MANRTIDTDQGKPIQLNVLTHSPHVLVYRLWSKSPGGAWKILATGDSDDNQPDYCEVGPLPSGSQLAYLFRIGGNPRTTYNCILTVAQDGKLLADGTVLEAGVTDDDGLAAVEHLIDIQ